MYMKILRDTDRRFIRSVNEIPNTIIASHIGDILIVRIREDQLLVSGIKPKKQKEFYAISLGWDVLWYIYIDNDI